MMLRTNKPMPESPRIVAKVTRAIKQGGGDLVIPWSDFVFSTRNGQVYMPPTLAKGIEMVSRAPRPFAGPRGVTLQVRPDDGDGPRFDHSTYTLYAPNVPEYIRHEALHVVQFVGDALIRLGRGDRWAFRPLGLIEHALERYPASDEDTPEAWDRDVLNVVGETTSLLYGGPKRRSARGHRYLPYAESHMVEKKYHALLDAEFQTDALTVAHLAVDVLGRTAARGPSLDRAIEEQAAEYVEALPPIRRKDFLRTVRQRAHALLDERAVQRAAPEPLPTATGLRIVQESVGGRVAYVIYRGAASTGKYGFSEAKAKEIMGRMRA